MGRIFCRKACKHIPQLTMSTQLRGKSALEVRRMRLGVKKLSTKLAIFGVVLSTTRNQNVP